MRKGLARAALGLGMGLILAEGILRARHRWSARAEPDPGLRPSAQRFGEALRPWRFRAVALGDSNTYGFGLAAGATYPALLEVWLRARGVRARVWNAGINGQTVLQGLARLERDVFQRQPDAVLVAFGLNDCHLQRWPTDEERERAAFPSGWRWFLEKCHLARTCWVRASRVLGRAIKSRGPRPAAPLPEPRVHPLRFRQALVRLVEEVRRRTGARVYLMTMNPVSFGHEGDRQAQAYHLYNALIRVAAWETGAALVDLEEELGSLPPSSFLEVDGVHLTEEGHRLVAEAIWRTWQKEGLVGPRL
ncbi:MAG: SGNH/GDSL hydrolase family protein [Anaerolineae bacterium]